MNHTIIVNRTVNTIINNRSQSSVKNPRFADISTLLDALHNGLETLPETAELMGLDPDNSSHFENVGSHTLRVVELTRQTEEFQHLLPAEKNITELSAYLHDIGKGPKSRWRAFGGRQQIDHEHPIKALPMLERIFSEEVEVITREEIESVCWLVAHHPLIGFILAGVHSPREIIPVIPDKSSAWMLFALSRADSTAINPAWEVPEKRANLYQMILSQVEK